MSIKKIIFRIIRKTINFTAKISLRFWNYIYIHTLDAPNEKNDLQKTKK
jgi:hypothetical protein